MKSDILKQYVDLRNSLEQERSELETRLREIEAVLGGTMEIAPPTALTAPEPKVPAPAPARSRRLKNPMSLREAIIQVTSKKPLTKQEIRDAVERLGYRFTGKDPMNSIEVVLYGKKFVRKDGKFSPPAGTKLSPAATETVPSAPAPRPVQAKAATSSRGRLSAEGRRKIIEATKARWAKIPSTAGGKGAQGEVTPDGSL